MIQLAFLVLGGWAAIELFSSERAKKAAKTAKLIMDGTPNISSSKAEISAYEQKNKIFAEGPVQLTGAEVLDISLSESGPTISSILSSIQISGDEKSTLQGNATLHVAEKNATLINQEGEY